jgi:Ca2+-binding RTX toxin-like protein
MEGGVGSDALFGRTGDDRLIERDLPEQPNLINGGPGTDRCFGGYTVPPITEVACERH